MKSSDFEWRRLHDAVLIEISVQRDAEEVRIHLRLSEGSPRVAEITMRGFTFVCVPNRSPWGPSVYVNEAKVSSSGCAPARLEIEMQSGDILEVEGGEMAVVINDAS